MNGHDRWRAWDKLKHCLSLMKCWMDGCVKENTRTCRWMPHQTKRIQRKRQKAWKNEIRQVNRKLEMQPSPSSSLAQPRDEVVWSLEQTARKVFVASQMRKRKDEVRVKNQSKDELGQLYQEILNEKNYTLRNFWSAMQWPCTQTDAKRACDVSMLQSSLPVATDRTLMKSNRILKEMKSDMTETRVHAPATRSWPWWCGQLQHRPTRET